ncbi:helicase RepA family protein [Paraburkholderia sp. CNPSo 3274]|uniref:helicase RepA family protein n=1 Tax=Paraburkholderia sp. CNPSo 3274 TaxID=2940932 RepID=UPI0020B86EC6|nr:helicase RepA family protein [Paraburkholderia sp. CNPSo 3274]MCP3709810.1 helicase RepA family protein [Paraburkholderia sp. CNPSo 3274]
MAKAGSLIRSALLAISCIDLDAKSGMMAVLHALDELQRETGCAILIVDHNGYPAIPEPPELGGHKVLLEALHMTVGVWRGGDRQEFGCQSFTDEMSITVA